MDIKYRNLLKRIKVVWYLFQYFKLIKRLVISCTQRVSLFLVHRDDFNLLKEMRAKVIALYSRKLDLKNTGGFPQYYHGKNVLGYTGMSFLEKNGQNVGMSEGKILSNQFILPIVQLKTDLETNFKNVFTKYRPNFVVDFGTNCGGSAVYFYNLMRKYCDPKVLTIDITDEAFKQYESFHKDFQTEKKIETILNKSTLDCEDEVRNFLSDRKEGDRVLLSFDDNHTYEHTFKELKLFGPLLKTGDVILMQDTWNQDLFTHETSPMLAVYKFLKQHKEFVLDEEFCRNMVLPCNFIYGLIIKK